MNSYIFAHVITSPVPLAIPFIQTQFLSLPLLLYALDVALTELDTHHFFHIYVLSNLSTIYLLCFFPQVTQHIYGGRWVI